MVSLPPTLAVVLGRLFAVDSGMEMGGTERPR